MERDSTSEDNILSKLQSSTDLSDINLLFTSHLHPFTPHFKTSTAAASSRKPKPKSTDDPLVSIRSLAKTFLPFLHKSLSIIPKCLSESPNIPQHCATELFDAYRLCLKCLTLIAPELAGKPYAVEVQKIRYIHCLENWELYRDAETEGFSVLECLTGTVRGGQNGKSRRWKARLVPEVNEENIDPELNILILEIVVTLVKCAAKKRSKVAADYWRVIALVNESQSLFRMLDARDFGKFHQFLVANLHITILFLVADIKNFDVDLICEFCLVTFKEYKKSHTPDQMYKVALKIFSSLFPQIDELSSHIVNDVLKYILDYLAAECEIVVTLVKCAAKKRSKVAADYWKVIALVNESQSLFRMLDARDFGKFHQFLVANLHITILFLIADIKNFDVDLICEFCLVTFKEYKKSHTPDQMYKVALKIFSSLFPQIDELSSHIVTDVLKYILDYLAAECEVVMDASTSGFFELVSYCANKCQGSNEYLCGAVTQNLNRLADGFKEDSPILSSILRLYVTGLLASSASNQSKDECIINCRNSNEGAGFHIFINNKELLNYVSASFTLFKEQFCIEDQNSHQISTTEREKEKSGDNYRVICLVVVAALMLSFKLNKTKKESVLLVKHVISVEWVPSKRLKYLCIFLHNLAVILYRSKRLKEAIKSLNLCCKASWNYAINLSEMHVDKLNNPRDDLSEKIVADYVKETSDKSAFLLNILNQEEPFQIGFMRSKDNSSLEHDMMLYSLLPSSAEISRRALGQLLEENLEKSRLLIEKGIVLRACGLEYLEECTKCLSSAVSILKSIYGTNNTLNSQVHHLLIRAYVLHAICTQETVPNSIVLLQRSSEFVQDIRSAVELCLNPEYGHSDNQDYVKSEDMLYLWYLVIDMLSVKGYVEILPGIYDVVIKLFNRKNFSLEKTVTELWKNQRLGHALCVSPINHKLIRTFSRHSIEICDSNEFWKSCMKELNPLVGFHHIDKEIQQTASNLIHHVPKSSASMFLHSHHCYKFAGRLISTGRMIEALSYAKEAHLLRGKLLQQKFEYTVEKITETCDENGEIFEKSHYGIKTFKANDVMMIKGSCDYEGCVLTPWNVLRCYLESILQVGVVHEILGHGSEAEMLLRWGKNVSQFKGLPLFEVSFSSILAKLYCKQKLWCLAEKELTSATKTFVDHKIVLSCEKCVCMLDASLNQQLGDLYLSRSCSAGEPYSMKGLSNAKSLYGLALDKLNNSEWRTFEFTLDEARTDMGICKKSSSSRHLTGFLETNDSSLGDESVSKLESKRSRRTKQSKSTMQRVDAVGYQNRRITRSTYRSTANTSEIVRGGRQVDPTVGLAAEHVSTSASGIDHDMPGLEKFSVADFQNDISSLCNKMKCWHCLHLEAVDCGSLTKLIWMEWELVYRKLSLRLLISIGKLSGICGNAHEAHKLLQQSTAVLFGGNLSCSKYSSLTPVSLIEFIGKQFPGDLLAVERAALLYYICWFALKSYPCQYARRFCCELSRIETKVLVSLLKLAFTLCREVPLLFQKLKSMSQGNHGWSRAIAYLSSNHFFNLEMASRKFCCELSRIETKVLVSLLKLAFTLCREVPLLFQKVSRLLAIVYVLATSIKHCSLMPSEEGLESQWSSFFHQASLGSHLHQQVFSTAVRKQQSQTASDSEDSFLLNSASTFSDVPDFLRLAPDSCDDLEEFVHNFFRDLPSSPVICISLVSGVDAILLRELLGCSLIIPAWILLSHLTLEHQHVILLPVHTTLEDDSSSNSVVYERKDFVKRWQCPWVSSAIDDIAPVFRHVLEGNYYTSSPEYFAEYIKNNTSLWWLQRNQLDECLSKFLQDMEDLWLGTWKYFLLGDWPDLSFLESLQKQLSVEDKHLLQHIIDKKCYVNLRSEASSKRVNDFENILNLAFKTTIGTSQNFGLFEYSRRQPIILVLDFELQMLPWENLPILRNQEVYRMPSVSSIFVTLDRCCQSQELNGQAIPAIPVIDPLDSYYLLNPDGDLRRTQVEFENWFRDQNIEGKTGSVPTIEELTHALESHDLFIYFGHGSGTQYIPGHVIQKLNSCAASLLLGCSSGSLHLKGSYVPQGAPISYLIAGSPVIIANLWEVTDKDIDRFGKAMLNAWLRERSTECTECDVIERTCRSSTCNHRRRVGSFMAQAREACTLGHLIGASPVCYGVPTGDNIARKRLDGYTANNYGTNFSYFQGIGY
ncbi:separase-like [Dorcoceras hygrometricum]|uniref:separase n=1 Tax=Dorcoceras hygrometricum TaxID=472368 RepID=A0A2Z7AI10_9LAMI|nr:separase-like [Dorcoceras hygrometricum]